MKTIKMLPSKLTNGTLLAQFDTTERAQWEDYICKTMQRTLVQYWEEHPAEREILSQLLRKTDHSK